MIKYMYLVLLLLLLFGCNIGPGNVDQENKSNGEKSESLIRDSCNNSICQFLSNDKNDRDTYFIANKSDLPIVFIENYDQYHSVKSENLIFNILNEFEDMCTKKHKEFYAYVLWQLTKNKNPDGFVAERYSLAYYNVFNGCPDIFYQFIEYLNKKDKDSYLSVISFLSFELSNRYKKSEINEIFKSHQNQYNKTKLIAEIKDSVLNY